MKTCNAYILICVSVCFLLLVPQCQGQSTSLSTMTTTKPSNVSTNASNSNTVEEFICKRGLILPVWEPVKDISTGDRVTRAIVYFLALAYMFLGISIIADRFMSSIEVITSKEREVTVLKDTGEKVTISVRIWNETVSNLTLMALGSSAPEILLSAIEVAGNNFKAGELGPGTIVGSAAFNLFVIISICIYVIPDNEVRRIKHLRVFLVTATWSLIAYLWLYLIVATISPGRIEIWEGVVTLIFFPVTVLTAYFTDKKLMPKNLAKTYRTSRHNGIMVEGEGETDLEMAQRTSLHNHNAVVLADGQDMSEELMLFEQHRKEYMNILYELRRDNPNIDMRSLEEMAEYEVINRGSKSKAFYTVKALRKLTGGGNVVKRKLEKEKLKEMNEEEHNSKITKVHFEPAHYTVMESVGSLKLTVRRFGGDLDRVVTVDYKTQDGTAFAGPDYEECEGTLSFAAGETSKSFQIKIIDDDIFEEDEHFYVKLSNLKYADDITAIEGGLELGTPAVATIMILDDDHRGIFHFDEEEHKTFESIGDCHVKVRRSAGCRGFVSIPYKIAEGTAFKVKDFEAEDGELEFDNDEHEKFITIKMIDNEAYKKDVTFTIELGDPKMVKNAAGEAVSAEMMINKDPNDMTEQEKIAEMGKPKLGEINKVTVRIEESPEFKQTVDKMMKKSQGGFLVGTSSWREQFKDALVVSAACESDYGSLGDDDDGVGEPTGEPKKPSCGDYVMHYLSLFWKILFATVPPTDLAGGWLCFIVSIIWIGLLTALVGDLASHMGCTIKLKDSVTAISFVALGTSVPDTFASKVAAVGDKYADSSIGNVTGSNAVNVFLGIGFAWTIAAVVNALRGEEFDIKAGSLAFSLTVYFIFAISAIALLLIRRCKTIGGELGGPLKYKLSSSIYLAVIWVIYVSLCSLEAYGHIQGF